MVPSVLLDFLVVFPLCEIFVASQQSALYRDRQISYGNFKRDWGKRLTAEKIKSFWVNDTEFGCPFMCVFEPKCFSFNVATYPNSKGLYLCEVLATDKYRAKSMLRANATFQHYSPMTPCQSNPCHNDGDCIPDFQLNSYHCDCKPGYTGTHCSACQFDFEDEISGWLRTGTVFNNQPTYGDNPTARTREPANQQRDWWIGGYEHRPSKETPPGQVQGDVPQGSLTSPYFYIKGNNLNFLLGGGCNSSLVRAELIVSNQTVRSATGNCTETMARENWDVQEFIGQRAQVKLVDASTGHWGHINFDDLRGDISCEQNYKERQK